MLNFLSSAEKRQEPTWKGGWQPQLQRGNDFFTVLYCWEKWWAEFITDVIPNASNTLHLFVPSGCLSELLIITAEFSGQCWPGFQVSKRVGSSLTSWEIPWLLLDLPGHNSNTISECSLTLSGQTLLSCCEKTQIKARISVFCLHMPSSGSCITDSHRTKSLDPLCVCILYVNDVFKFLPRTLFLGKLRGDTTQYPGLRQNLKSKRESIKNTWVKKSGSPLLPNQGLK